MSLTKVLSLRKVMSLTGDINRILQKISYKKGHRFSAIWDYLDNCLIFCCLYDEPNILNPDQTITLRTIQRIIPECMPINTEEMVLDAVKQLCLQAARHEVDEWLKYDGVCLTEPHPELLT